MRRCNMPSWGGKRLWESCWPGNYTFGGTRFPHNPSFGERFFMKMRLRLLLLTLTAAALAGAPTIKAAVDVNVGFSAGIQINSPGDFYEPLSPYGEWVNFSTYGRCWRPTQVDADWRPYSNGHWEWTDAGWYWQSDEPWAWACYHYGSWANDPSYGWVWIPATDWAPSWVTWR